MIPKIPDVPKEIIDAVNNRTLAVFIGSGVSQIIGCNGWDQLAQRLIDRCFQQKKKDGSSCINFRKKDVLSQSKDYKKTITICKNILKDNGFEDEFYKVLNKSLKADKKLLKSQNIYDELYHLPALFLTTNIDKHFDDKFHPTRIAYKNGDFDPLTVESQKLYHIHGSLDKDKKSIILTVPDYIQRYCDSDNSKFGSFMKRIFHEYVVLFIGYGLSEFEVLDFLITKHGYGGGKPKFILLPYYQGDENFVELENGYYKSMGITVLAYEKDEIGHHQLYEIIRHWNSEIQQTSTYLSDSYRNIDDAIDNYEEKKVDRTLQIIKNDKSQKDHFFKKLASSDKPFPWLKILKENDYFNPTHNLPPQKVPDKDGYFSIPYWNVLGYLENVALQNAKNPSDEVTESLLDIINSIANCRNGNGERVENDTTDWFIVKIISKFPTEKITRKHIEFIGTTLKLKWDKTLVAAEIGKTVLPKLINGKATELVLQLIDEMFDYQKINGGIMSEYTSVMTDYWLSEALKEHKSAISKLCGINASDIAINKIRTLASEDINIWIPTIEDSSQTSFSDRYEYQLVHFIRDMFELSEPNIINEKIGELLNEEAPIIKRIALHTISHHYKDLNGLFWNWKDNPLNEDTLRHELHELLKANCSSFSKKQIDIVLGWIESKKYYISDEVKRNKEQHVEKRLAYLKRDWLLALLEIKDIDITSSYEKYTKINPTKIDHPGFDVWIEAGFTGNISPIEKRELLSKSNEKIAEDLINYKEDKGIKNPTKEGLSDILRDCVLENPEKFANNMKPFLDVQNIYLHALLRGLSEAWRSKKNFTWESVLNFISQIVESVDFWNGQSDVGIYNYQKWIISQIADLIEEGTKDDNNAFNANLLPQAERILLRLAEKTESDLSKTDDLVISVLNSSKGKIFSAMMTYSIRYAGLLKNETKERWAKNIKKDFDKRLDRKTEPSLEFSLTLGKYLANLAYLDKQWLIDNINKIFLKDDNTHWNATFTGYLFYSSKVYKDIYFLLRENGHYTKALQNEFGDSHTTEHLIQHICIGYLEDFEKLDEKTSLISKLIEKKSIPQLLDVVSFFWMLRDKPTDKIKSKVKPLWNVLFELLSQNEKNPEYQKIISNLSMWLSLIDEIDEQTFEWLKLSAKYAQTDFNTYFFIEYLLKHTTKTPSKVGELYLEMLKIDVFPEYKKEDIQEIVRILYRQGQKGNADRICNLYIAKGFDLLDEVYGHRNDDS